MANATEDRDPQAPDDAAKKLRPEDEQAASWSMSFERLSGFLQN